MSQDNFSYLDSAIIKAKKNKSTSDKIRVLAITCSLGRPYFLHHCVSQMNAQSYPTDHAIYINSKSSHSKQDRTNYISLIENSITPNKSNIYMGYGASLTQHLNHMSALNLIDINNYDLFCKIDDDDIYLPNYIDSVVKDYEKHHWDFSGTGTEHVILGDQWQINRKNACLGITDEEKKLGILSMMPGTYSFSKKAIKIIQTLAPFEGFEDPVWRRELSLNKTIKKHIRESSHYIYHVHGKNISTGHIVTQ